MEASPNEKRPRLSSTVRLEADAIQRHLQNNESVSPEKALMIYLMQHLVEMEQ